MPREFSGEGSTGDALRRFEPPRLSERAADRIRRAAIPRVPLEIAEDVLLDVTGAGGAPVAWAGQGAQLELHMSVGGEMVYALVPSPLLQRLLYKADIRLPADRIDAELAAMLLESVLSERIEALETLLQSEIALLRMTQPAARAGLADITLSVLFGPEHTRFPVHLYGSAPLLSTLLRHWEDRPRRASAPVETRFRLASRVACIDLTVSALRALEAGDAMLFDRVAIAGGAAIVLSETLWAPARFDEDGSLFLSGAFADPANSHLGDFAMSDETGAGEAQPAVTDTDIGHLPVRLVFEIGRREVTLDELRDLNVGTPLPLERALTSAVDIFANGRRIGTGEMVMIGEQLGVRVTRLVGDA